MAAVPADACLRCVAAPPPPPPPPPPPAVARRQQHPPQRLAPLIAPHRPAPRARWAFPPGQEDGAGRGRSSDGSNNNDNDKNDGDEDDDDDKEGGGKDAAGGQSEGGGAARGDDAALDPLARLALAALRLYRQGVSPLLQPACRYQPTCSRYAIAAYRAYGGWRGTVLTTWRLARCAPWGEGGFDPPRWPPPGLEPVFRYDAAAPVAVVLTAAGFVRLVHALLFE